MSSLMGYAETAAEREALEQYEYEQYKAHRDATMPMDATERLLVQRGIAAEIDYPSVFMGGPSHHAMRKAGRIIANLERAERLVSTTCDHHGWMTWKQHGATCPDCGTLIHDKEPGTS
jgi:hypothetical protein